MLFFDKRANTIESTFSKRARNTTIILVESDYCDILLKIEKIY